MHSRVGQNSLSATGQNPFQPGSVVVLTLGNPREKLWGSLLALTPEGLSLSGIEVGSFEDVIAMVKAGEPFSPCVFFFPMHRVERVELDLAEGSIPSLSQRFADRTHRQATAFFNSHLSAPGAQP